MVSKSPETAGPTTVPTCMMIWVKANAAEMWRASTRAGTDAVRAVEANPANPAPTALTHVEHTGEGWAANALAAKTPLVSIMANVVHAMILRRSTASPTGPAARDPMISGMSWARLMAPTWKDEWVCWYTW